MDNDKVSSASNLLTDLSAKLIEVFEIKCCRDEGLLPRIKSTQIYIETLKELLKSEDFCKSKEWVEFIKYQVEELDILLDEINYNPLKMGDYIGQFYIDDDRSINRAKAGNATALPYRKVEKDIIIKAQALINNPHDGRPANRYRITSLSETISSENNKQIGSSDWLKIPAISTVKSYLRKAVRNGELPAFLCGGKPKKW